MPENFRALKRISNIVDVLNENVGMPIPTKKILTIVNRRTEENWCKSQIEKDLFRLKMDFDMEYSVKPAHGIFLEEKFDFISALKAFFK